MPILSVLLFIPFVAVIALLFIPDQQRTAIRVFSSLIGTFLLIFSVLAFSSYDHVAGGYQMVERYAWLPSLGITFHLAIDGISAPMVLLTGIVIFCGVLVSLKLTNRTKDFFLLLFVLVGGVYGVFMSLDLFFFFFFYEVAVLPMYLLISVWGSSSDFGTFLRTKEYGAMKLMLMLVAGSVPVWIALIATFVYGGMTSFDLLDLQARVFSREFQIIFYPMYMIGFGVLAGLWPFHTWSPDGHVAAPTAVSMLHAGVLMKLGAFGIIRVGMPLFPEGAQVWMPLLLVLATVNVLYGAVSAMGPSDLKSVIGYSSVSHMGYVLMGFATLSAVGVSGAVLQMFSHGIMTALFFSMVGSVYDQAHTREIAAFSGLAKRAGVLAAFFAVAGFASLGLPGLSGFIAEFLIFVGLFQQYPVFGVLAVFGAAITAVYILRLVARVFFGPLEERWAELRNPNPTETLAMVVLVFMLVCVGVYPQLLMAAINSGVAPLMTTVLRAG
ncbi:MAG: NADH-quinone oxidoreductase subunit M [Chloroflexi bacterium]|nr:NADH-quinone oxidoreductase subunit M [Chloroflexota bacterium]